MTIVAEDEGKVDYELSNRPKRRTHIRIMLLRAQNEFLKTKDKRVSARPSSD
jgi:hypothetical protein